MRSERKKQIMTLSILLVAVLVISVGFAAFSATLKIKPNATVNPDASDFKVVFSSSANTLETNPVPASPSSMGESATIDNTTVPTIRGLEAKTKFPGDTVTYIFYVRNEGGYEAFLNSITFRGKNCIPEEGTSLTMVDSACNSITTTVSVGNVTTTETKTDITGESLKPGESKQVTVTLSYDSNGAYVDGPFTVEFGDISMYYATVNGMNEDLDGSEILYTGQIYRNSTENLYIGHYINANNRWCAVVPGVASSCVYNDYINEAFSSKAECEISIEALANSGNLTPQEQYLVANAVCEPGTLSYETTPTKISENYYLKHDVVDNKVIANYACITYIENGIRKDACLRGGDSPNSGESYYASNQSILRSVESYFNTLPEGYCSFEDSYSYCQTDTLFLEIYSSGGADTYGDNGYCSAFYDGHSRCY